MPTARVLPRKFLATLEETQSDLRTMAHKCKQAIILSEAKQLPLQIRSTLQELEVTAYRLAFDLSELRVAGDCVECPSAPASTLAKTHLLVLADELDKQAEMARCIAQVDGISVIPSRFSSIGIVPLEGDAVGNVSNGSVQ